jgi:hypothetical protein
MKLFKTPKGKILIILYYALSFIAVIIFMIFILLKTDSILAGLGIGLVLGICIGILGGELEFREHCKVTRLWNIKNYL